MAKTTTDYQNDGAARFRADEERPIGNSWQAKAMQAGYDCAQTEAYDAREDEKAEEKEMHNAIMKPEGISILTLNSMANSQIKHLNTAYAVQSHINHLEKLADAAVFGGPKFMRYVGKIEKLEAKYGITHA